MALSKAVVATVFAAIAVAQTRAPFPKTFLGEPLVVDDSDASASVCLGAAAERRCFQQSGHFTGSAELRVVQTKSAGPMLFLATVNQGGSGSSIDLALLRLYSEQRPELYNILPDGLWVSNLGERAFWEDREVSEDPIFVTVDWESGPDEAHYSSHRYMVSAYLLLPSDLLDVDRYHLADRYLTVHRYSSDERRVSVLESEREEIVRRLRRVAKETGYRGLPKR